MLLDVAVAGDWIVAVGERGIVLRSNDGGISWEQLGVPTRRMLTAVCAVDARECWAVGHDATILHSEDRGVSWSQQYEAPDDESPLFDVWFADSQRGIAVGGFGLVLQTSDGGRNWHRRQLGGATRRLLKAVGRPARLAGP